MLTLEEEPIKIRKKLPLLKACGLAVLFCTVFFLTAEITLRIFYFGPDALFHWNRYEPLDTSTPYFLVLSENPRMGVELRSDHRWYFLGHQRRTNSIGIADDRSPAQLQAAPAIVILGESFAEGGGVDLDQRFSAQLEKRLQPGKENVLNLAITNTTLESQVELLKQRILTDLKVSYVVVAFLAYGNMNDPVLDPKVWERRMQVAPQLFPLWKRFFSLYIFHDYLSNIQWNPEWFAAKLRKFSGTQNPVQPTPANNPTEDSSFQRAERLLAELKALGDPYGFKVVLAPLSHIKDLQNPGRESFERGQIKAIAQKLGVDYWDLFPALDGQDPRYCILWSSNQHMNPYAHARVAERLARYFVGEARA